MTIEEILAGESKNVEFKENLPEKSLSLIHIYCSYYIILSLNTEIRFL